MGKVVRVARAALVANGPEGVGATPTCPLEDALRRGFAFVRRAPASTPHFACREGTRARGWRVPRGRGARVVRVLVSRGSRALTFGVVIAAAVTAAIVGEGA